MTVPNLALDDPIDEAWVDAVSVDVNNLTSQGWTNLALDANWAAAGGAGSTPRYRKRGDIVELAGEIIRNVANAAADSRIATLPVGFRPTHSVAVVAPMFTGAQASTWFYCETDGELRMGSAVNVGWSIHLVPLTFPIT